MSLGFFVLQSVNKGVGEIEKDLEVPLGLKTPPKVNLNEDSIQLQVRYVQNILESEGPSKTNNSMLFYIETEYFFFKNEETPDIKEG